MATSVAEPTIPARTRNPVLQRLVSFPLALAALLMVLAVLTVRSRFDDPDMWWHLKMGQVIVTTHSIPSTDIFSYTTHRQAYVAHEWLSQVLIYAAYRAHGYSGLMLWLCFFSAAALVASYVLCSIYSGNAKLSFLGGLIVWLFGTIGFAVRPQVIGYLLLIAELIVLELGRTRNRRWLLALPPLFAIWVTCHGSFALGLAILLITGSCAFLELNTRHLSAKTWSADARRWLVWMLPLSLLALCTNPAGLRPIVYPLNTMLHQHVGLAQVQEWQPVRLDESRGIALLALAVCIILLPVIRRSRLYVDELLMLVLASVEAISHKRLLFVFGIIAAPILCRLMADTWDGYDSDQDHPWANAGLIALCVVVAILAFPSPSMLWEQVSAGSPVKAVQYITSHRLAGPILNDYAYGGYLIWAAPEYPVFIDGRADVYEWTGVLNAFGRWATLQGSPSDLLDNYGVNLCLLSRGSPMAGVFPLMPEWTRVYSDEQSVVFARRSVVAPLQSSVAIPGR